MGGQMGGHDGPRDGFVKHTDKDVVVYCIFKDDKKHDDNDIKKCLDCFKVKMSGPIDSQAQLDAIEEVLGSFGAEENVDLINILCKLIDKGAIGETGIESIVTAANEIL